MIYIIKTCVKCIYFLQKHNNQLLCRSNTDPKKNNDIESRDDSEENDEENMLDIERLDFYNFLYIYVTMCCEMYTYIYVTVILFTYIFIFYVMIQLYSL